MITFISNTLTTEATGTAEERKMGSIDRYGNMGIEYSWVVDYFKKKDDFWLSPHSLGKNMVKNLKAFLNDSEITIKGKFSPFGEKIDALGIETSQAWGLILTNLAYTSEFNWWIKNVGVSYAYTPDEILSLLDSSMSQNSRSHIVSAYKNILISNSILSNELGLGTCDYEIRNGRRYWNSVVRKPWDSPDHDVESEGVSPTEIFSLDRSVMEKILNGLNINHPDFVTAQFNLDLDTITLNSDKTSEDVLTLF